MFRKREQDLQEQNTTSTELCNNLRKHLDTATNRSKELENEVAQLKNDAKIVDDLKAKLEKYKSEITKLQNDNKCKQLEESLKRERDECASLKKQLKQLSESLNESVAVHEASIQEKDTKREKDIQSLQSYIEKASEEREILAKKLLEAQEREISNKIKVSTNCCAFF